MVYDRGPQPFPSRGQKQTLQDMEGHTDFPPLILFILLFMMLIKYGIL